MKSLFTRLLVLFVGLFIGLALSVPAQCGITGAIKGEVKDASTGEPLPFADILISGPALLKPYAFSADQDGKFVRAGLPPGTYTIEVVYVGYLKKKVTDISVLMDRTAVVTVQLEQQTAIEKEIEVVATNPLIEKEVSGTSDVIDGDYIEDMPIQGRAYQNALKILPGTLVDRDQNVHIRGGRTGEVGFKVDGMNAQDPVTGGYGTNVNMNAVEKMEVITGGYDAEYGGNMSGMVNVVTKSGTDTFHGDVHFNYQSDRLDGVDYDWRSRNPGFTLKGPIIPEKLNFFMSFELEDNKRMFPTADWPQDDYSDSTWTEMGGMAKFTWQAGIDDKFVIQYFFNSVDTRPGVDFIEPVHLYTMKFDYNFLSVNHTHTFTPEVVLESIIGYGRMYLEAKVEDMDWRDYSPWSYVRVWDEARWSPEKQYGSGRGDYYNWQWREVYNGFINSSITWIKDDHRFRAGVSCVYVDYEGENVQLPYYILLYREDWSADPAQISYFGKQHFYMLKDDWDTHYGGAYIQDRWSLDEKYDLPIFLNYGFRYDWQEANNGSEFSPRLGLTYTPDDKTRIRVQYGWFFQVIPLMDAMSQPSESVFEYGSTASLAGTMFFDHYKGASGLSNPINKAFEFGIEREVFPDVTIELTYYDKDMQDLLQSVDVNPDPAIDEWQLMNVAGAWARGAEVTIKKAFSKRFEGRASYTYQEAKSIGIDRYGNMTGSEAWLDWDLRHALAVSFNIELPYDINLNGVYSWNSGFPYTRSYLVRNEETDQLEREDDNPNEEREPYYSTFDLTLLKEFKVRDYTLSLMVQSYNLFDHRNVSYMDELKGEPGGYEAGRRLLFGMKFEF
ncbi:MAG: TonB-dependent receptor [Candidatus Coatesbacteria bacterium]|nr:TonB-dependent receptor [Candidatus Coatesbacteria bacterium]